MTYYKQRETALNMIVCGTQARLLIDCRLGGWVVRGLRLVVMKAFRREGQGGDVTWGRVWGISLSGNGVRGCVGSLDSHHGALSACLHRNDDKTSGDDDRKGTRWTCLTGSFDTSRLLPKSTGALSLKASPSLSRLYNVQGLLHKEHLDDHYGVRRRNASRFLNV